MGLGMVLRDDGGSFIVAKSLLVLGCSEPRIAKASGVREALNWIKRNGWSSVIIETDSQVVFNAIHQQWKDVK